MNINYVNVERDFETGKIFLNMGAEATEGDLDTINEIVSGEFDKNEDFMLMPTNEVAALVNEIDNDYLYEDDCDCLEDCVDCPYQGWCLDDEEDHYIEPRFGGAYYDDKGAFNYIEKVIYNDPETIVLWNDGTKTSSRCDERDKFNPEMGLTLAVLKKITSSDFVIRTLEDWAPNKNQKEKTLRDVRREHKDR